MSKLESSAESPVPLRRVSQALADWIGRLGEVWIEGQIAQFVRRPGVATCFLTLRDVDANVSMQVTCHRSVVIEALPEGARVIVRARPDFYAERGTLSLRATEVRQVGLGELLARIERLKQLLTSEGLFAASRKHPLPFLPRRIGLITGRSSAAERDVVENARRRFPAAEFVIENTATQGATAVNEVVAALKRLDAQPDVEVIVITRGGGSVEDLLPFSNEALLRAVSACRTPVVSAIGHETDRPLLDLVADYAASTPTDAAKHVVPDLTAERSQIREAQSRLRGLMNRRLETEHELMAGLPQRLRRGVAVLITAAEDDRERTVSAIRTRVESRLQLAAAENAQLLARLRGLSPHAVLNRGYAVVWDSAGALVRDASETTVGQDLRVRVARGEFNVRVAGSVITST